MKFLEDLFLNYIPAALIVGFAIWYFFAPKKSLSQEITKTENSTPVKSKTASDDALKLPPTDEVLIEFARDLSGNNIQIVEFARAMMRDGKIDQKYYDEFGLYEYSDFGDVKGNGPEYFASAIIHASTELLALSNPADPIRTRLLYVDWKEDLPELIEGFEAMLAPSGVKSNIDPKIFEDEALLPYYSEHKAPPIASAHYRPVFSSAGYRLLEIQPATGWDAYLFAAIPRKEGRRWNLTSLRASKTSPKKTEAWIWDAYYIGEKYVLDAKPENVPAYKYNENLRLSIVPYWEK